MGKLPRCAIFLEEGDKWYVIGELEMGAIKVLNVNRGNCNDNINKCLHFSATRVQSFLPVNYNLSVTSSKDKQSDK